MEVVSLAANCTSAVKIQKLQWGTRRESTRSIGPNAYSTRLTSLFSCASADLNVLLIQSLTSKVSSENADTSWKRRIKVRNDSISYFKNFLLFAQQQGSRKFFREILCLFGTGFKIQRFVESNGKNWKWQIFHDAYHDRSNLMLLRIFVW